jgi:hypothetical protein
MSINVIKFRTSLLLLFWGIGIFAFAQAGQIAIPRIEQMPNEPAPFNIRNWGQVALKYDSFVYDATKTGTYLPLVFFKNAGVNYPASPVFGLNTYVGVPNPGNEAINVLPSLVGASLMGIDKQQQFGRNWLVLAQDFYNKANGENLFLNNAGAHSGQDWWYDMMPNVYFYQLTDLYPQGFGESKLQFTQIADRLLEASKKMGGSTAPWTSAYLNYRAWNFEQMKPLTTGVKEPEAAGAFAWLLYHAYQKTGDKKYLQGAEWCLEFLSGWPDNPSYELQLPYGTYIAAKMNAELNTRYDVEKMLNWSFNRGALRGWGTIVGKWGGFDVSGLVGEANDGGNDYAFQLNGVQQAAALVPMLRYDKRFARAIGKWMLNLSNANRLFYPGFLTNAQQDASAWSNQYDLDRVIGYEALREKLGGKSPVSTGDALAGKWAATNLSLYSTSSIGYLGAIVKKTNVEKILCLDVLKTDFFHAAAYPTYLLFNPYATTQRVELDLGNAPVDVYNTLQEAFVQTNVQGKVALYIPANEAQLLVLTPAGGVASYVENKFLVNGVVVDYRQSKIKLNARPRIQGIGVKDSTLVINDQVSVFGQAIDPEGSALEYLWSVNKGTVLGKGKTVQFNTPSESGQIQLQLIVKDSGGLADTASLLIKVVAAINKAPEIIVLEKSAAYTAPSGNLTFNCLAKDANQDPLVYTWSVTGGSLQVAGATANWQAPGTEGLYTINVEVKDPGGLSAKTSSKIWVRVFAPAEGDLVAFYPFQGDARDMGPNHLDGQVIRARISNDRNGIPAEAFSFDGKTQHILVPNNVLLNFEKAITLVTWFKVNATPDRESFLLSHGSWQQRWKLSLTPTRQLRWTLNSLNGIKDIDSATELLPGQYHQATATYDGSYLALYLDGELESVAPFTGKIRTTTLPLLFGQMWPDDAQYNFAGVLDEVRLYNYALPPDKVKNLYKNNTTTHTQQVSISDAPLQVAPNPFSHSIHLLDAAWKEHRGILQLYQTDGKMIKAWTLEKLSNNSLDLSYLPAGSYWLKLSSNGQVKAQLIIKQ